MQTVTTREEIEVGGKTAHHECRCDPCMTYREMRRFQGAFIQIDSYARSALEILENRGETRAEHLTEQQRIKRAAIELRKAFLGGSFYGG